MRFRTKVIAPGEFKSVEGLVTAGIHGSAGAAFPIPDRCNSDKAIPVYDKPK